MHNIPGETKEECAKRLKREYDQHIDLLWDDYVDHLADTFSLSNEEAFQLLDNS